MGTCGPGRGREGGMAIGDGCGVVGSAVRSWLERTELPHLLFRSPPPENGRKDVEGREQKLRGAKGHRLIRSESGAQCGGCADRPGRTDHAALTSTIWDLRPAILDVLERAELVFFCPGR